MTKQLKPIRVYFAAELFNLPARFFNDALVSNLERENIQVFSPQRNGFEFSRLAPALAKYLPASEIEKSLNILIYAFDLKSIWESDIVIARFDEPSDPGVDTEVLFANFSQIPVITYRTDVRSPYGNSSDKFAGMHSFPVKESQVIIFQKSSSSPQKDLADLSHNLITQIKTIFSTISSSNSKIIPANYKKIFAIATLLFKDVDVSSQAGLTTIAKRYLENIEIMHQFGPCIIS